MISTQLSNLFHTNEIIKAMLVMDRRELPTDAQRNNAAVSMVNNCNLLDSAIYPINGLIVVEGFADQIKKMVDSPFISTASLINE